MPRIQYDLSTLLQTFPENSIGTNLIYSTTYDDIKRLRTTEDNWAKIEELTIDALSNKSKDLQIVGWLLESLSSLDGLQGICTGIKFLIDFINVFWNTCYPLMDQNNSLEHDLQDASNTDNNRGGNTDIEQKFRILDWIYEAINKRFILMPLCGFSLYEYNYALELQALILKSPKQTENIMQQASNMKKIEDINQIINALPTNDIKDIMKKFQNIKLQCTNLQNVLQNIKPHHTVFTKLLANMDKINNLLKIKAHQDNDMEIQPEIPESNNISREEIYSQLQTLVKALEKIDRHSPSPYLLKLIINWQNKSLLEVITDLKTGNSDAHQLLKLLLT